jgi:subtilisin-like proprotein convertase family protein
MKFFTPLTCLGLTLSAVHAATIITSDTATIAIPDGSSSGLARQLIVSAPGESIVSVQVDLSVSAIPSNVAFLGDLYFYLNHESQSSVLLNRAGRSSSSLSGYSDNQSMNVTFSESATNDIHNYRLTLKGNQTTPLSSALNGIWQADGRATDPSSVLDTDARTAGLNVFNGTAASGAWNLFAADLSTGAVHQLTGWTLRLTTVPEPSSTLVFVSASCISLLYRRRKIEGNANQSHGSIPDA